MNRTLLFNDGWTFAKSTLDTQHWQALTFTPVEIPHDWLIADTNNLYEDGIGWYKRVLTADANREAEGVRKLMLLFEGVYMDSTLYVNGQQIGEWKYGYSTFEFDIFPALKEGDNEIVVKVVHQSPNSRWYSGAGIYRNVWLKTRGDSYIDTDGVYVSTSRRSGIRIKRRPIRSPADCAASRRSASCCARRCTSKASPSLCKAGLSNGIMLRIATVSTGMPSIAPIGRSKRSAIMYRWSSAIWISVRTARTA